MLKLIAVTSLWGVLSGCASSDGLDDEYSLNTFYSSQPKSTQREPDSNAKFFDISCDADRNPFPGVTTYDCSR